MRNARMLVRALGVEGAVVEDVRWEGAPQALLVQVRPLKKEQRRCPHCGRRCPRYDGGDGPRRWRAPDVGLCPAYVVGEAPRIRCREHGVVVRTPFDGFRMRCSWARSRASVGWSRWRTGGDVRGTGGIGCVEVALVGGEMGAGGSG